MPSRRSPDPFAVQLGERIRQIRKEKKMSLNELARAAGISRGHLSDIEQGKVVMMIGTLGSLARALETPPFVIGLVPADDPDVVVVDRVLAAADYDLKKAAEIMRAAIFGAEAPKEPDPDE